MRMCCGGAGEGNNSFAAVPLWINESCMHQGRRGGYFDLFFLYIHYRHKQTVCRGISETLSLVKYQLSSTVAASGTLLEADLRFAF